MKKVGKFLLSLDVLIEKGVHEGLDLGKGVGSVVDFRKGGAHRGHL